MFIYLSSCLGAGDASLIATDLSDESGALHVLDYTVDRTSLVLRCFPTWVPTYLWTQSPTESVGRVMCRRGVSLALRSPMIKIFINYTLVQANTWMDSGPFKCLSVCLLYFFCWFIGSLLVSSFLPSPFPPSPLPIRLLCLSSSSHISLILPFPFETELCYVVQAGLEQVILLPSLSSTNATVLALFSLRIHSLGSGDIAQWSSTCLAYLMTPETCSVPR